MLQLSNEQLSITIAEKGAELQSLTRKDLRQEYLWSGDPAFWGKKSPVLFPVVGGLKQNSYRYNGQTYTLGRHGFARDRVFTVVEQTADTLRLQLVNDAGTLQVYPFPFRFEITYTLQGTQLTVTYKVLNTGDGPLFFSVGGHPAFKVPLAPGTAYEDYYLYFNQAEDAGRWPLSPDGLIERMPQPLLEHSHALPLTKPLFYEDALVLKALASDTVTLKSDKTPHGLEFHFGGFPYLGIWAAKDADFVCIEPWCGIADHVDASGELEEKEGIMRLEAGEVFEKAWWVRVF
ncbi:aldose 1-epimerase family protein [Chitinophaga japonensis]|uniref:Galactose mutarotase-like enzyme n=1 Tax=Chitinophaga japonensis TaxID=104662 RepID=A0A562SRU4_CHIJA|nr:aldose 1-epimerase family protein [Chitinophaga japonensis]TWI83961.1 galactose mutarotase-like enzyme [Chitinophaga japonensis]